MKRSASAESKRKKETQVVRLMIELYCRGRHGTPKGWLCLECQALAEYAAQRVAHCPHMETKTFLLQLQNALLPAADARENTPGDALFRPAHAAASPGDGCAACGGNRQREKNV